MNNLKLISDLIDSYRVRCRYWSTCSATNCDHHGPHSAMRQCKYHSPVKYCRMKKGFVYDVPYIGNAYADDECDPNLAFKAKRDAERREESPYDF